MHVLLYMWNTFIFKVVILHTKKCHTAMFIQVKVKFYKGFCFIGSPINIFQHFTLKLVVIHAIIDNFKEQMYKILDEKSYM